LLISKLLEPASNRKRSCALNSPAAHFIRLSMSIFSRLLVLRASCGVCPTYTAAVVKSGWQSRAMIFPRVGGGGGPT
jgi:hypothetical protein